MTRKILLAFCVLALLVPCLAAQAKKKAPPYKTLKIYGVVNKKYDRVSLFRSGGSTKPYKTSRVRSNGKYSLSISIPKDMKQKDDYYLTDMRFWKDKNKNGIKEKGELRSECHFIIWYPSHRKVVMNIYDGPTHDLSAPKVEYNYH
jgi:hypothetical protein